MEGTINKTKEESIKQLDEKVAAGASSLAMSQRKK
jgi:hypothetical protein